MLRIILGIIVGYVVWSLIWVGSDIVFVSLFPMSYGAQFLELQAAVTEGRPFRAAVTITVFKLALSIVCSLLAGFFAVLVAKERTKTTMILGIALLLTGIFVEASYWSYFPLWYHLPFLILLIPVTILGGRLKKV